MATIKDVAERAGVSTATVSYVINGTGTVTEATRKRVLEAVADLSYQPNYAARSLRSRSRTLGLVLPALGSRLADPALAELVAGLSEGAAAHGYYLLLATAGEDQPEASLGEQLVRTGRVDGLVLLDLKLEDERVTHLCAHEVPVVAAGLPPEGARCPYVALDLQGAAQLATRHLLDLGHHRIAMIALPSDLAESEPFSQGYSDALEAAGVALDPTLTVEAGAAQDDGVTAMQELLGLPEPPTAVLAASDDLAFGAMHALRDAGITIGQGVALVGCGDVPLAAHSHPPLTTLRVPRHTLGLELARRLAALVERQPLDPPGITLALQLIRRKTTLFKADGKRPTAEGGR